MSAAPAYRPLFERLAFHTVDGEQRVRSSDLATQMGCVAPWRLDRWIDERRPAMEAMGLQPHRSQVIVHIGATVVRSKAVHWLTHAEVVYVVFKAHTEASEDALVDVIDRGVSLARQKGMLDPVLGRWPWDLAAAQSADDA